ncbi:prenyltransferase [Methanocella sp. MCL-LM]|uniref:prenyltransferase n=1 Tax=Methanocella sp. MCL-LM TaxID=3412035 RepID=UPI003C784C4A
MLSRLGAWVKEFRLVFLLFAVIPMATGSIVAYNYYPGQFSVSYFILSLIAIVLLHAGTIAFNDFFDYWTGADRINKERTPFTGGTGLLIDGTLKPAHVLVAGSLCFLLCITIGMYIVLTRSPIVFLFGVVGVGLGAFYTAPPLKLAYRLLGEITWFLSFPLTALGALFTQAPPASLAALGGMADVVVTTVVVMLPAAFLGTAGFFVLEFPDYNADRVAKKLGVVVLLGKRKTISMYVLTCVLAYLSIIAAVAFQYLPVSGLTALITIPLFGWVWTGLKKFLETPVRLVPYIVVGAGAIYLSCAIVMVALFFG